MCNLEKKNEPISRAGVETQPRGRERTWGGRESGRRGGRDNLGN